MENAQYTDNSPVAFNETLQRVTVANWDDVKSGDKTAIGLAAVAKGFTVIT